MREWLSERVPVLRDKYTACLVISGGHLKALFKAQKVKSAAHVWERVLGLATRSPSAPDVVGEIAVWTKHYICV